MPISQSFSLLLFAVAKNPVLRAHVFLLLACTRHVVVMAGVGDRGFFRSRSMTIINCKAELSRRWDTTWTSQTNKLI
jgi:hypothetical protein